MGNVKGEHGVKTYQDFLKVADKTEKERMAFVSSLISEHKASALCRNAVIAHQYFRRHNVTIETYQKLLYTVTGKAVPDNYSANWKMKHAFFKKIVVQEVQHLLGNGVNWSTDNIEQKLGIDIDTKVMRAAKKALIGSVSFGFYNLDHVDIFDVTEYAPLYDEEDGSLKSGVRFWQIDANKPLRATLYELDGYTDYIWHNGEGSILHDKRPYILKVRQSEADGTEIYDFANYPTFPIVPLWANEEHQGELDGIREQIDCYDLIKSGFANDVDDASMIYWTIQNAGGMDDVDLAKFVERMHTVKAAAVDSEGATAEAHTMDVPYASRDALLDRIKKDLYSDAMALDTETMSTSAATATEIKAAYKPLDSKCDDLEYCVIDWLQKILDLAGIEGENPTFTRDYVVNKAEEINSVLAGAQYLTEDYVTRKIMTILGDGDQVEDVIKERIAEDLDMDFEEEQPPQEQTQVQEQTAQEQ